MCQPNLTAGDQGPTRDPLNPRRQDPTPPRHPRPVAATVRPATPEDRLMARDGLADDKASTSAVNSGNPSYLDDDRTPPGPRSDELLRLLFESATDYAIFTMDP